MHSDDALYATSPGQPAAGHALARPGWGTPAWAGAGVSLAVDRFTLAGPFVFAGRNLQPRWAAAIDLALPCAADGLAARPGANTYAELTSRQRHQYLAWLAGHRNDPLSDEALLRVFLSGVEDYLLAPRAVDPDNADIDAVLGELQRLGARYRSQQGLMADQCLALHDFFRLQRTTAAGQRAYTDANFVQPAATAPAMCLRFALGHLREDRKKLSARWAYQWARCLLNRGDLADVALCEEPLRRLFVQKYVQSFGEGIALPEPDQTVLELSYTPINPAWKPQTLSVTTPPVSYWPHVIQPLAVLLQQCLDELRPYLVQRRQGAGEAECWSQLPVSLWPEAHRLAFRSIVQQALDAPTSSSYAQLAPYLRLPSAASKKSFTLLKNRLAEFGLAVFPDFEDARRPKTADDVFVLLADSDEAALPDPAEPAFELAARLCLPECETPERRDILLSALALHVQTAGPQLTREQRQVRRAHLAWLAAQPLKKLTKVSWSKLDPQLRQSAVGLLRALVARPADSAGIALPGTDRLLGANWRADTVAAFELNADKVSRLTAETAQVHALLGAVFAEDEPTTKTALAPCFAGASKAVRGQSPKQAFLAALAEQDVWSVVELEALAAKHRLMLGATLEWANEKAFDQSDAPVLEEVGDGWIVDQDVLQQLLAQAAAE